LKKKSPEFLFLGHEAEGIQVKKHPFFPKFLYIPSGMGYNTRKETSYKFDDMVQMSLHPRRKCGYYGINGKSDIFGFSGFVYAFNEGIFFFPKEGFR
jgi:hypothetical protein